MMDVEDLEPSWEHVNEFVKEKDLLESEIWELEDELEFKIALAKAQRQRKNGRRETRQHGYESSEREANASVEKVSEARGTQAE